MKNDMRITYPLWQMVGIVLLVGLVLILDVFSSNGQYDFVVDIFDLNFNIFFIALIIFGFYLLLFWLRIKKHNKLMPQHKIKFNTWKPQEYMEEDEMFREITRNATKKVYSFFVWAIPIFAGLCLGGSFGRTVIILGILFLGFCQYFIYYWTIRKYLSSEI